jgi:hypothetical protein
MVHLSKDKIISCLHGKLYADKMQTVTIIGKHHSVLLLRNDKTGVTFPAYFDKIMTVTGCWYINYLMQFVPERKVSKIKLEMIDMERQIQKPTIYEQKVKAAKKKTETQSKLF